MSGPSNQSPGESESSRAITQAAGLADTRRRMIARIRADGLRRDAGQGTSSRRDQVKRGNELASGMAGLGLARRDWSQPTKASEALRMVAVGLTLARQSFLASRDLSDLGIDESLPAIRQLSVLAESLVHISDAMEQPAQEDW
jgi:hypothetical protein